MYAVVINYTFDQETLVYLFDEYNNACQFLKETYQDMAKEELEESSTFLIDKSFCCDENDYAELVWESMSMKDGVLDKAILTVSTNVKYM